MAELINRIVRRTQAVIATVLLLAFSALGFTQMTSQGGNIEPQAVENVEALLDKEARYYGQIVTVPGKVKDGIVPHTPRTFILESGGFFNDEIVVVIPANLIERGISVREGSEVRVTGTVYPINLEAIKDKYSKNLTIGTQVRLETMDAFLIVDRIEYQQTKTAETETVAAE
ncbi:hypothetical protein [Nitrosococcus wardiae]|uniref:Uncharacterized protein n=1 Tax=Nitrosococcus wardiae TaxID=1814290 RepID=A0A4P7C154_9GAMM|nr:hypothetical protein [Nitrosococcus wardiae]QBQ55327.1 hypothetical protein E3U44_13015 [Nitrosococcus wardiae]